MKIEDSVVVIEDLIEMTKLNAVYLYNEQEALEIAIKSVKKQIPKKPLYYIKKWGQTLGGYCACCGKKVSKKEDAYCSRCGQRIDWKE